MYRELSLDGQPESLFRQVMKSDYNCLIIPPDYVEKHPQISEIKTKKKSVGLFSSGTTGRPKCIWNTYHNLLNNAKYTLSAFDIEPTQKLLMLAAPWHVAGLSWGLMAEYFGNEYRFIATKKGDTNKWYQAIRDFKPEVLLTVPGVLRNLMDKEWHVPKIIYGGTPLKNEEIENLFEKCDDLIQGYGQTEAGGLISSFNFKDTNALNENSHQCCGKPIQGVEIKCSGTVNKPEAILVRSQTASRSDYYKTGDLGYKDGNGNLYVVRRIDAPIRRK